MGDKIGRRKKKKFSVTSVFSVFYFLTTEDTEFTEDAEFIIRALRTLSVTSVFFVFYFLTTEFTEDTECIDNSFTNRNIRNTCDDTLNRLLIASAGIGYNIGRRKKKKFSVPSVLSVFFLTTDVTECIDNSFTNRNIRNTLDDAYHGLLFCDGKYWLQHRSKEEKEVLCALCVLRVLCVLFFNHRGHRGHRVYR